MLVPKMRPARTILSAIAIMTSLSCSAAAPSVVLYQPDGVLVQRLGDNAAQLAEYIEKVQAIAEPLLQKDKPERFDVVIVVKPGSSGQEGRAKVWFVSDLTDCPSNDILKRQLEAIHPPSVMCGPIAFALSFLLNGASTPSTTSFQPPIPAEWKKIMRANSGTVVIPDGIIQEQ